MTTYLPDEKPITRAEYLAELHATGYKKVIFYKIEHYDTNSLRGWHRSLRKYARPYTYKPWGTTLHFPITITTRKDTLEWMFEHVGYGHFIMRGWKSTKYKKPNGAWSTYPQFTRLAEIEFLPAANGATYRTPIADLRALDKLAWRITPHRAHRKDTYLQHLHTRTPKESPFDLGM